MSDSESTLREVSVKVESSTIVVKKLGSMESWSRYEVAPLDTFQRNVGVRETPVVPFGGKTSVGAAGGATIVVKCHTVE